VQAGGQVNSKNSKMEERIKARKKRKNAEKKALEVVKALVT
jgi:hypothetical protein